MAPRTRDPNRSRLIRTADHLIRWPAVFHFHTPPPLISRSTGRSSKEESKVRASYRDYFHRPQSGAPFPDTALSAAFLKALVRLVTRGPDHFSKITLPTGPATIGEIKLVLRALDQIRNERRASQ